MVILPEDQWPTKIYQFNSDDAVELMQPKLIISNMHMRMDIDDSRNILEKIFRRLNGYDKILTTTAMLFLWLKNVSDMTEAAEKAKMFLIGKQELSTKEIDLIKRNFIYKKVGDIHYALSRSYMENQQVNQKKLVVI